VVLAFLDSLSALFSAVPFAKSFARLLWPSLGSWTEPAQRIFITLLHPGCPFAVLSRSTGQRPFSVVEAEF